MVRVRRLKSREGGDDRPEISQRAGQPVEVPAGPGDRFDDLGPRQRPLGESVFAQCGQTDDRRQRLGPEGREMGQPLAIEDRQVVGPGMKLDRQRDRAVRPDHRGQDVRQRKDP